MNVPNQKVSAATAAAALACILVFLLTNYAHIDIPPAVSDAITTIVVFVAGYFTPHSASDVAQITHTEQKGP